MLRCMSLYLAQDVDLSTVGIGLVSGSTRPGRVRLSRNFLFTLHQASADY